MVYDIILFNFRSKKFFRFKMVIIIILILKTFPSFGSNYPVLRGYRTLVITGKVCIFLGPLIFVLFIFDERLLQSDLLVSFSLSPSFGLMSVECQVRLFS